MIASSSVAKPPYKITSTPNIGRSENGRFVRLVSEAAPKVLSESLSRGVLLNDKLREVRVPDREVGMGAAKNVAGPGAPTKAPVYPDAIPWPKADNGHKPFKA